LLELDKFILKKRTLFLQLKAEEKVRQELKTKSKKPVEPMVGEIIEIEVNTVEKGKKNNKDQAQAMAFELKGSIDFITENMKEFLDEIREKEMEDLKKPESVGMFQFILDNIKEFNDDTMAMFFQNLKYHVNQHLQSNRHRSQELLKDSATTTPSSEFSSESSRSPSSISTGSQPHSQVQNLFSKLTLNSLGRIPQNARRRPSQG
jgi:hypothetical protein